MQSTCRSVGVFRLQHTRTLELVLQAGSASCFAPCRRRFGKMNLATLVLVLASGLATLSMHREGGDATPFSLFYYHPLSRPRSRSPSPSLPRSLCTTVLGLRVEELEHALDRRVPLCEPWSSNKLRFGFSLRVPLALCDLLRPLQGLTLRTRVDVQEVERDLESGVSRRGGLAASTRAVRVGERRGGGERVVDGRKDGRVVDGPAGALVGVGKIFLRAGAAGRGGCGKPLIERRSAVAPARERSLERLVFVGKGGVGVGEVLVDLRGSLRKEGGLG